MAKNEEKPISALFALIVIILFIGVVITSSKFEPQERKSRLRFFSSWSSLIRKYTKKQDNAKLAVRTIMTPAVVTMPNDLSSRSTLLLSIDDWYTIFQVISALALGVTIALGFVINKRQSRQVIALETQLAEAREKQAVAERELLELKERIKPRHIDRSTFLEALTGQPKAPVEVLYLRDDPETLEFAQEIDNLLKAAGWTVTAREPIPVLSPTSPAIPTTMSVGGQPSGVTVVTHSVSEEEIAAWQNRVEGKDWVRTPRTVLLYRHRE